LFENTEAFYLKNFLVLIQGMLSKKHGSISAITMNPITSKQFDHCQSRYTHGQVVLTIGEVIDSLFQPLEMIFTGSVEGKSAATKNKNTLKPVDFVSLITLSVGLAHRVLTISG
jgi:hypothetical protein